MNLDKKATEKNEDWKKRLITREEDNESEEKAIMKRLKEKGMLIQQEREKYDGYEGICSVTKLIMLSNEFNIRF